MNSTSVSGVVPEPRILIADDDPTMVLLLEHVLEGMGRPYETVDDGKAAWEAWKRSRHELVVLDIEMPGMDGLEVSQRIREEDPQRETYILVVTGRDRAADLDAVLTAGADDYVTKPTTGQRLLARLRIAQRRMAVDRARRIAEQQVRHARWLSGIGETLVALQHEINNPLTSLLATTELLILDAERHKRPTDDLRLILEQTRRISDLVKGMSDLREPKAVPYSGKSKMIDLKDQG